MQDKILNRVSYESAKVDVLINYWNKLQGKLQVHAIAKKDKGFIALMNKILMVPKEIKYEVLSHYLRKCFDLHQIAFMQWRYMFPNKVKE